MVNDETSEETTMRNESLSTNWGLGRSPNILSKSKLKRQVVVRDGREEGPGTQISQKPVLNE